VTARSLAVAYLAAELLLAAPPGAAHAEATTRVSVATSGGDADAQCIAPALSANGRFVAFQSEASNLVAADGNGHYDVFIHDRRTGAIARVSQGEAGAEANADSIDASLSADGRFVAYVSDATNLVAGDGNESFDVFVHDRKRGETRRVSVDSTGQEGHDVSLQPALSASGRVVAFLSFTELVPGDTNRVGDIYVHETTTGRTARVSIDSQGDEANDHSTAPVVSRSGRFVAFESVASDLTIGDTNDAMDIFVHDRRTGETRRVSVDSGGGEVARDSRSPSISANGRFVAFQSDAVDLVANDTNGLPDVFVHDRKTGATTRVSVDSAGGEADGVSGVPVVSASGRYVALYSAATNLVPDDDNGVPDVFVHDRATGLTRRVSVRAGGAGGDGGSILPIVSADGRIVAFESTATDLVPGDGNAAADIFVYDARKRGAP
jgi:Tol biopolymer transport system component